MMKNVPFSGRTLMVLTLEQLKDVASDLPLPERAELARFLVHSLDEQQAAAIRAEWLALAASRMADVKAGKVVGIPADEVLKGLLESGR
jgi:putative addiction module component (TIGR02574 family)